MTTTPGIRLPGRQAVHRVGRQLGPAVAHPPRAHDAAERLDHLRRHGSVRMSGRAPPRPLVWARRCTRSADSTLAVRIGTSMSRASTRRAVERSTRSRCLTPGSHSIAADDVEREAERVVGQVGLLGLDVVELAEQRVVADEHLAQPRGRVGRRVGARPPPRTAAPWRRSTAPRRPASGSARTALRPARRCSSVRRAAPGSPGSRRRSRRCPPAGGASSWPAGVIPNRRSPWRQSASIRRYRGSKMCSGSGVPGKRTTERGKIGRRRGMERNLTAEAGKRRLRRMRRLRRLRRYDSRAYAVHHPERERGILTAGVRTGQARSLAVLGMASL